MLSGLPFLRVARCSQPWALRRNPFGIRLLDDATCGEYSAPKERVPCRPSLAMPLRLDLSQCGLLPLSSVRLARRADIPVRSNVFRGNGQQIRAVSAFGRGCGQESPRAAKHMLFPRERVGVRGNETPDLERSSGKFQADPESGSDSGIPGLRTLTLLLSLHSATLWPVQLTLSAFCKAMRMSI